MNQKICKIFALLILFQLISSQTTLDLTSGATVTIPSIDDDGFRYILKKTTATPTYSFVSARLNPADNTFTESNYDPTTDHTLKVVSKDYTCAIFVDATSTQQKFAVVDLTSAGAASVKEDLITSTLIDVAGMSKSFEVANSCTALKIDDTVYHFKSDAATTSKYVADTLPTSAWSQIALSGDFVWAAGNGGIYKYDTSVPATPKYVLDLTSSFNDNKKIWATSEGIVVMSWVASGTPNVNNYTVRAFKVPASGAITLIGELAGQYYETVPANPPTVSIAENLKTIVVYGKLSTDQTKFFAKGASISFSTSLITQFQIPTWITATQSAVSVSDRYLYARNLVDNGAASPVREVGSYFVAGSVLTTYKGPSTVAAADVDGADWTRTKVFARPDGQLNLIIESVDSDNVITSTTLHVPIPNTLQFFSWDKKDSDAGRLVTGAGITFKEHESKPQWFLVSKLSTTNTYFESVRITSGFELQKSTYAVNDQTQVLKAVSTNYKCALIFSGSDLKVVSFIPPTTALDFATVTASLYGGITIDSTTKFDVSDDCKALRINNKILHYYAADSAYFVDTYQTPATALSNPVFNEDFSLAVTDTGVYKYSPKTAAAAGIYNVDRAETYPIEKKIWKDGNNYILALHEIVNNTHFSWKVQAHTIVNGTSTMVTDFKDIVQTNQAEIIVSPKLSKIIIKGISATNAAQTVYVAKTIDWMNKNAKDITLPTAITSGSNKFALSDDFIYLNNYQSNKQHTAWVIMGSTCIQAFTEAYQYPTINYERSWILPDSSNSKRLLLAHQYALNDFVKLFMDRRKTVSEILNPNPVSTSEMTFTHAGQQFVYPSYPYFGRWMYASDSRTKLNLVEYKTSQPNKKKLVTSSTLTGNNLIVAASQNFDCGLTFVAGSDLMTIKLNTDYTLTTLSAWSVITPADMTAAQVATAIGNQKVGVGAGCWAVRIGDLVYVKNGAGSAFVKSDAIADLTTPVFDPSLNFAFAGGDVFQYTGTVYERILTVTGLKSTVELITSEDKRKLILFSYEASASGPSYVSVVKAYHHGTAWTQLTLPTSMSGFTTYNTVPNAISEPTLETIGVWYNIKDGDSTRPLINLAKVDYAAGTVTLYENPSEWTTTGSNPSFSPFGNYLYVYKTTISSSSPNVYTELFYKIDKANTKIVFISTRPVSQDENNQIRNGKFYEESGNIYALYEYHSGNNVKLIKRLLGSQAVQSTLRGIEAKDTGLLVQNGQVYVCPPGCSYCLNTNTCEICLPGFVRDANNNCLRCGQLCASCGATTLSTCITCINGYYESSGSCVQCSDNCLTCSSPAACLSCKVGFYKSSSDVCLPCIDNCVACNPAVPTDPLCTTCRKGYVYNTVTKSCVKCIAGCVNCNPEKVYECLKCGEGFDSSIVNSTLVCTKCPQNCLTCLGQTCQACRNGFRLVDNKCIAQCKLPCKECSATDATKCTSCVGGYNLNGESCNPDLSCNTPKTCTGCPFGYNLIAGVCYQCNGGPNCRTCDSTNIEVCASCNRGYYLTSTATCAACNITGCVACSTDVFCQQCKPGYVLSGSADSGKCIKCDDTCATCFDSPTNCETCATGFTKRGWNCINNNNIKIFIKINAALSSFTTANYESIEIDIADRIGKDRKNINVEEIKTGSVDLTVTVNSANIGQQTTMVGTLQAALATGATIGGFSVETSTVTAVSADATNNTNNGGTPQDIYITDDSEAQRYRDIAIIVGVVIPVSLIIIFIVFFILYKKGIICAGEATKVRDATISEMQINQKETSLQEIRKS